VDVASILHQVTSAGEVVQRGSLDLEAPVL
jgi:hypothetical protein